MSSCGEAWAIVFMSCYAGLAAAESVIESRYSQKNL